MDRRHNFLRERPVVIKVFLIANPKENPMYPHLENEQDYLAAKFHISDSHITQASHLAFLKIQSWKFALRTPTIGKRYREEAEELIKKSFCTYVPNSYILSEEGYYFSPLN
ncbi:MAG: hypothetical protein H0X41_01485 [Chitinophagaceae bacterium]|nr:hypothetical protein [Chitinophagaceae bacterium]